MKWSAGNVWGFDQRTRKWIVKGMRFDAGARAKAAAARAPAMHQQEQQGNNAPGMIAVQCGKNWVWAGMHIGEAERKQLEEEAGSQDMPPTLVDVPGTPPTVKEPDTPSTIDDQPILSTLQESLVHDTTTHCQDNLEHLSLPHLTLSPGECIGLPPLENSSSCQDNASEAAPKAANASRSSTSGSSNSYQEITQIKQEKQDNAQREPKWIKIGDIMNEAVDEWDALLSL